MKHQGRARISIQIRKMHPKSIKVKGIKDCIKELLLMHNVKKAQISIVLADDEFLRTLNTKYRGNDAETDTLSFPLNKEKENFSAELFVSLDKAKESAMEFGHTLEEEVKVLLLHGLLHCLGYTHKGYINYRKQKDILKELPSHFYESKNIY